MHHHRPQATTQAIQYLMPLLTPHQRMRLCQLAIDNGISVRDYVGRLAAQHGLWRWVEPAERRSAREWPVAFGEEIR